MWNFAHRRLYLCTPLREDVMSFVREAILGGVDVVQLREKHADDETQRRVGMELVALCHDHGVPFVMNDSPELALETGADGVHVGQDDLSVQRCRELLGDDAIVGLSTHSDEEFTMALSETVTYRSAGPVVATPTKEGRAPTGVSYAVRSQARSDDPVFVTGGVDVTTLPRLLDEGLRHFVVVRALTTAHNPREQARALRTLLDERFGPAD